MKESKKEFDNSNKKTIIVTPSGRRKYLHILLNFLKKQKKDFDEWHLWNNCRDKEDEIYIYELEKEYEWISVINRNLDDNIRGNNTAIHRFFDYTTSPNTVYIRLDDDIVYLEDNFVKNLVEFRLENPNYFLVYANIINNNIINHIHYRMLDLDMAPINYDCMGNLWNSMDRCKQLHQIFQKDLKSNDINKWKFSKWVLYDYERVSINAISWIGGSFENFGEIVGWDEEQWLSCTYPSQIKTRNVICGNAICVHGAFYTQRNDELEKIIQHYSDL